MNELVFVDNGRVLTDSLTVAQAFGKRHDHVVRDIENQIEKLIEADEEDWALANFGECDYINDSANGINKNRKYKKFLLTEEAFTIVAFAYTTPEAMRFKVEFIEAFKKMREKLNGPRHLSEREQLIAAMKLSIEASEELAVVKEEVKDIKQTLSEQLTLDHGQQATLHHAIKQRVESIKDDYDIPKSKLYHQIHSHLRRAFTAPKYIFVKRKDFHDAMAWVKSWRPLL